MCGAGRLFFHQILFGIFAIVMPVVVTNMLIGLATGNIDKIQQDQASRLYKLRIPAILRGYYIGTISFKLVYIKFTLTLESKV